VPRGSKQIQRATTTQGEEISIVREIFDAWSGEVLASIQALEISDFYTLVPYPPYWPRALPKLAAAADTALTGLGDVATAWAVGWLAKRARKPAAALWSTQALSAEDAYKFGGDVIIEALTRFAVDPFGSGAGLTAGQMAERIRAGSKTLKLLRGDVGGWLGQFKLASLIEMVLIRALLILLTLLRIAWAICAGVLGAFMLDFWFDKCQSDLPVWRQNKTRRRLKGKFITRELK